MPTLSIADELHMPVLPQYLMRVQKSMLQAIQTDNPYLQKPFERLIPAGGKRLRSSLVLAIAGGHSQKVDNKTIAAAAAVELVHIGSLVHDDIIDNANTRWHVPTVNSMEGSNHAILVGDFLFAKAFELGAGVSPNVASLVATSIAALIDGESRELAEEYNPARTETALLTAIGGKTAALMKAACQIGGYCAKLSTSNIEALGEFGYNFGMAFQLIDDVLDFVSLPELLGKPVGNDVAEGVYTLPVLYALQGPSAAQVRKLLALKEPAGLQLIDLLVREGAIAKALEKSRQYNQVALAALARAKLDTAYPGLANLPNAYCKWALTTCVNPKYLDSMAFLPT